MSPEAQLFFTGAAEVAIGIILGWCAYMFWKRRGANDAKSAEGEPSPLEVQHKRHSELLSELGQVVGAHTHSVELFQKWIEIAAQHSADVPGGQAVNASPVQLMRAANRQFDQSADSKTAELSAAVGQNPALFQDVSTTFSDHRKRTSHFETALSRVPAGESPAQVHTLTFESLQGVLETKRSLEAELASAKKQIEVQAARLRVAEQDARLDALTRIPNRRAFDEHIDGVHSLYHRQGIIYSLIVVDLDNFKQLNDAYGHLAGDAVLQVTAKLLESQLRLSDRAFRLGGEEFVIVLVATDLRQAKIVAERARKRIETSVVHYEGRELRVTASLGIADVGGNLTNHEVLESADAAMYHAKNTGRNRVEVAQREVTEAIGDNEINARGGESSKLETR